LIFCQSKNACENTSINLKNLLTKKYLDHKQDEKQKLINELKKIDEKYDSQLIDLIKHSIAFHHSGLIYEEKEIIEKAYKEKIILILCATSTLAGNI
jgi:replicative superfamily II helicase